jgi:hypothetical protein
VEDATHYQVFRNDGSGYVQIGEDVTEPAFDEVISVHDHNWQDALYQVSARDELGELAASESITADAAMLDNLLEGRFILGVGAGILRSDAEATGVLDQDRHAMFQEAIKHIIGLWSGKPPYNLKGRYWSISTERTVFSEYHAVASITGIFMVRFGRYKYIHYEGYRPQLYDLEADRFEAHDLALKPGHEAALAERNIEWLFVVPNYPPKLLSTEADAAMTPNATTLVRQKNCRRTSRRSWNASQSRTNPGGIPNTTAGRSE